MSEPKKTGAFAPINGKPARVPQTKADVWQVRMPVPIDASSPPERLYSGEKPSQKWRYVDASGALLGLIYRFDNNQGKDFRPLVYCHDQKTTKSEWRWKSWTEPRPLYGLNKLASNTSAPVLVVEGEKCTDTANNLLPGIIAITSPGGSKAAGKADWSALAGRKVIIWPDNDKPGIAYAKKVAALALETGATSLAIITPPEDKPNGWDLADAVAEGWTINQVQSLIDKAENHTDTTENSPEDKCVADEVAQGKNPNTKKRVSKSESLLKLLGDCQFWRDKKDNAYATFTFRGRIEHAKIRDAIFKTHVNILYYDETGGSLSPQAEEEVYRTLSARAVARGVCHKTWNRVAFDGDNIVVDLANKKGELVYIDSTGWKIITSEEIKFLRSDTALPMPMPMQDDGDESSINLLRRYCNVENNNDFMLAVGWIMGAFRPRGPYTILTVTGEMGSGKSYFSELIASIVDPHDGKRVSAPKDERDLFISAIYQHTLLFDNLSGVSISLSDSFCRLSTGGAIAARKLHSDDALVSIKAQNPIVLNGIPDLSKQSDLADRSIPMQLKTLEGAGRMTEEDLNTRLKQDMPKILGGLFDGISSGVRNWETTKLEKPPRMADFARWVEACSSGLGWEPGEFIEAYNENRKNAYAISFESDAVAQTLKDWLDRQDSDGWEGPAALLLLKLSEFVTDAKKKEPGWPKSPSAMGTTAMRIAPLLRRNGYDIRKKHSGNRSIVIKPVEQRD